MKRFFLAILLVFSLIPALCSAEKVEPIIRSDIRTFNPLKGLYDLRGNVFVQFPVHDSTLTITGDNTQVYIYNMEVHGQSNITLSFGALSFKCDKVDVYHSERTAYVEGNCNFQDGDTKITANKGSYCWSSKIAAFQGNVRVNGQPHDGDIAYNVLTKELIEPKEIDTTTK